MCSPDLPHGCWNWSCVGSDALPGGGLTLLGGWVYVNPYEVALGAPSAVEMLLALCNSAVPCPQGMNGGRLQCFACSGRHFIAAGLHMLTAAMFPPLPSPPFCKDAIKRWRSGWNHHRCCKLRTLPTTYTPSSPCGVGIFHCQYCVNKLLRGLNAFGCCGRTWNVVCQALVL